MPLYQYGCTACGEQLERRQGFNDPPLTECPRCGSRLARMIHPAGIIFKGSGWYCTDHRSKAEASTGKDSPSPTKGSSSTSEKATAAVAG